MKTSMEETNYLQEQADIKPILCQWGYEHPCLIGRGAFARVYRVWERASGAFLACKVSTEQNMLDREGKVMREIEHPLFPKLFDKRCEGKWTFLLMEYVPGTDLGTLLVRRGAMTERQAIRIGIELAEGLRYLHERSTPIVFRDVKPENIVIREDGRVKLLDFGSACSLEETGGAVTGTPGYAAPEQWEKLEKVGLHSDVYALGQVMLRMLNGRRVRRGVQSLIEDCVRTEVGERVPNIQHFLYRLKPYVSERKGKLLYLELKARLRRKKHSEYFFQQNVLKM